MKINDISPISINEAFNVTRMSKSSWFKLKIGGKIIHFDPGYAGFYENQGIPESELDERADMILISHNHKDHIQELALQKIRKPETMVIAPFGSIDDLGLIYNGLRPGDQISVGDFTIIAVDAYNTETGHSTRKAHHKGDFVGYLLKYNTVCLYFAGDTDVIDEMRHFGKVDFAFLPIGGTYVMDSDEAVEAVKIIQPKIVFPMHHANADMDAFKKNLLKQTQSKAIVLNVGDHVTV